MKKLLLLFLLSFFSFANEITQIDLSKQKWEYKWGDSLGDSTLWQEIDFPRNPPNRNNQTNIWFRVQLPQTIPSNSNLYIVSIDLITQVYFKDKQIYSFGEFDENGKGKYKGWPWHLIPLPTDSAGEYLYFRIYSNYGDIGFWGEILILSKGELYEKLLKNDILKIIIGSVSIFVAIFFLLTFLSKFQRIESLILGLLFLTQGLNVFCSAKIMQLFFYYPLFNQYILAIAFFSFPIGMALFMDKVINYKILFNPIKKIWQIHLIYLIIAILGSVLGFFSLPSTYEWFDIFYNFITLPILTFFIIYFFYKGDKETKIITFSFFIISLYWLYSTLIAAGIVPWEEYPSDIAVFICLLFLSYSIVNRLNYTKELEEAKIELTNLTLTDYLTNLSNRKNIDSILKINENLFNRYKDKFSIILVDIDDFKKVNDTYGHLVGDKVLIEISGILKKYTRQTDIVGRWGGEEFIIICPKTNLQDASKLAEKLRKKISTHQFETVGNKTASLGVSTFKENETIIELITRVDDAMYLAKSNGKNRIEVKY
ncbi:GGDEF domain-containing protein [Arcobacter aquimarinus]|uniref:diguanylate cyclase n=1 Tax=Arcobacter aquimarinus TaxID=1315211 RepID=A0AAE7B4W4_9BACT|nr:GGDEF domain-containing protein [Arcobacter aquimarinus]QKE25610.1 diguanylate cyclase [Arcobacter aquimarinus]RXI30504.1 diguanylate cyclase [Arcobacter aquimarinus]